MDHNNNFSNNSTLVSTALSPNDSLSPNEATIAAYDKKVSTYVKNTPQTCITPYGAMIRWIDKALSFTTKNGNVLEIGSATPRDARYMRAQGYQVQCSDATPGFVAYLQNQGENAQLLNIITDPIYGHYDMIFANAVVPHFTYNDLESVLIKIKQTLKSNGIFAFSVKRGTGEAWITEKLGTKRYTHYWLPDEIKKLVTSCGYHIAFIDDELVHDMHDEWIYIIAQKAY